MPDTRSRLQVHLPTEQYLRWQREAESNGISLAEFVRRAVEDRIEGRTTGNLSRRVASESAQILLPEIERLLMERLPGASPDGASLPAPLPTAPVPVGPRAWDPSCYTADLHHHGVVCTECGGSFLGRR